MPESCPTRVLWFGPGLWFSTEACDGDVSWLSNVHIGLAESLMKPTGETDALESSCVGGGDAVVESVGAGDWESSCMGYKPPKTRSGVGEACVWIACVCVYVWVCMSVIWSGEGMTLNGLCVRVCVGGCVCQSYGVGDACIWIACVCVYVWVCMSVIWSGKGMSLGSLCVGV
jgi:hypothetical protein